MRWDTLIILGLNFAIKNPIAAIVIVVAGFIFINVNSQPAYVYKPQPPDPPRVPFDMTTLVIENVKIEPLESAWQYGVSRATIDLDITNNSARELAKFGAKVTVRDCDKNNKCVIVGEANAYHPSENDQMQSVNILHGNKRHEQWELYFSNMPRQPEGQSRIIDHEFYAEGY